MDVRREQPAHAGAGTPACVLVVDDHLDFREALSLYLQLSGFRVLKAHNGAEAVASARKQPPDAIIMDVNMPVLDGVCATALLKASPRLASIPVIGCTAHPFEGVEARAKAAGMWDVLPKDNINDVVRSVRAALNVA